MPRSRSCSVTSPAERFAGKERDTDRGERSGRDLLRDELVDYLDAQMEHLVDKAGGKLGDVTDQLLDVAENGESGRVSLSE
ncbi:hypothetical protein ACFXI6_50005 [Streptomyces mirabilis]|uniref:hypothetical protein n=1 Tax=Streptomyces mirabilis TaxID=68239 RepID=UPI0036B59877